MHIGENTESLANGLGKLIFSLQKNENYILVSHPAPKLIPNDSRTFT